MSLKLSMKLVFVSAFLCAGLGMGCPRIPQGVCRDFFALPAIEQQNRFRTLPVDQQLAVYRCGMTIEPPTLGFAYLIAEGSPKNISTLLDSLNNEKDESFRADMMYIFEVVAERGDLKGREDVVRQLMTVVSGMHGARREDAREHLLKIENATGVRD
jgi:hypothetical protein